MLLTRFAWAAIGSLMLLSLPALPASGETVSATDVLGMRLATEPDLSPDGASVTYTLRVPRRPADAPGADYRELWIAPTRDGEPRMFVGGEVAVYGPQWSPDGSTIAFRMRRGSDARTQVWAIPVDGGEAKPLTRSESNVLSFRWHPRGNSIVYIATTPPSAEEKKLKDKGFGFGFYEEDLKDRNLYVQAFDDNADAQQLTHDVSVWTFDIAAAADKIAITASEENLIDHRYMFRDIYILDLDGGEMRPIARRPGKLGNISLSPDGRHLAWAGAINMNDHDFSQAFVAALDGDGPVANLTPPDFNGHVVWVGWKDDGTLVYRAEVGAFYTLSTVPVNGGRHRIIFDGRALDLVAGEPSHTADWKHVVFEGSTAAIPNDIYYWSQGREAVPITNVNPWVAERELGKQELITYKARDGLELEGILIYPVGYAEGQTYPLVVQVHGGPESRNSAGWQTFYNRPMQVLAGKGYVCFLPNYRSSTGYGVDQVLKYHLGDPAGAEFDDIADGIDYLADAGIADRARVGLGGGSYGGYAAAWFSSYYTEYVRAVVMFVGLSDIISRIGTTDIPWEEQYVHSGKPLEEMWELALERSPIYHAHKSRTAVLIAGGTSDTRVDPSQSLEYYRRLKMNDHPAVRYIRYPGEGHGNAKQPGRIDYVHRMIDWYDWYVKDRKPLAGPMPPLDISDRYGIDPAGQ